MGDCAWTDSFPERFASSRDQYSSLCPYTLDSDFQGSCCQWLPDGNAATDFGVDGFVARILGLRTVYGAGTRVRKSHDNLSGPCRSRCRQARPPPGSAALVRLRMKLPLHNLAHEPSVCRNRTASHKDQRQRCARDTNQKWTAQ